MHSNRQHGILFLLPRLYPCATGGIEIFHHYFVQAIGRFYNVYVCSLCDRVPGKYINLIHYQNSSVPRFSTVLHWKTSIATIHRLKESIDLIHLPYSSKQFVQEYYLPLISRLYKIPYIIRIHGGGMHPSRPLALHQMLFDRATGIMAVSDPIRKEYEERHGKPIRHIPSMLPFLDSKTPVTELKVNYGLGTDDNIILFVGSIKKIKGLDILLSAFHLLGKEYIKKQRLKLVCAGDGDMWEKVTKQVNELGIQDCVLMLGFIPHEKICELYNMADIFVIPSLMEARPLALSEALHNGVPSIASRIPTLESIIDEEHNGLLFETGNAEDLCKKIRLMIEDSEMRHQLGKTARERYRKEYQFDQMVQEYRDFYDEIIVNGEALGKG